MIAINGKGLWQIAQDSKGQWGMFEANISNICNNCTLVAFSYATGNKLLMLEYVSLFEFLFLLTLESILLFKITYNLFEFLDYLIVFVSYSNILLGRDGEGTSS